MELGYKVDARRALELGCLPEPYLENDRSLAEKLLDSYAGSYLREEIQSEALSRNLEGFSRFLATAAAGSGQFLDFSKLSQRARVARTSAIRYFDVLEDTLIAYRIPPYPDAQKADLVQHPRYYFFDPGVLNGILGNFTASPDRIGILFETLLVSQLRAAAMARDIRMELFTFRTRGGVEVDFIVRLPNGLWAIEANASSHIHEGDARSLEQFRTYCSEEAHCVVVTLSGVKRKLESGTLILPWTELLKEMGL
jgi:predicted AAA+ superfamily ATPase